MSAWLLYPSRSASAVVSPGFDSDAGGDNDSDSMNGLEDAEGAACTVSNLWKSGRRFFQCLENARGRLDAGIAGLPSAGESR
jgi:hypothetical protein